MQSFILSNIGAVFIVAGMWLWRNRSSFAKSAVFTMGTVERSGLQMGRHAKMKVSFDALDGHRYSFYDEQGSYVGPIIAVAYDPANPATAYTVRPGWIWFDPLVLGLIGGVFLVFAFFVR